MKNDLSSYGNTLSKLRSDFVSEILVSHLLVVDVLEIILDFMLFFYVGIKDYEGKFNDDNTINRILAKFRLRIGIQKDNQLQLRESQCMSEFIEIMCF